MIYQGSGSNYWILFRRGRGNLYGRGQDHGFNTTKPKVREKYKGLNSDVYSIRDPKQADKYNKTTEAILINMQRNFNKGDTVK